MKGEFCSARLDLRTDLACCKNRAKGNIGLPLAGWTCSPPRMPAATRCPPPCTSWSKPGGRIFPCVCSICRARIARGQLQLMISCPKAPQTPLKKCAHFNHFYFASRLHPALTGYALGVCQWTVLPNGCQGWLTVFTMFQCMIQLVSRDAPFARVVY